MARRAGRDPRRGLRQGLRRRAQHLRAVVRRQGARREPPHDGAGRLPAAERSPHQGTVAAIERELVRDGFVARYPTTPGIDGLPPGEGTFLACSFWLADNLALLGRRDDARRCFERLLALRTDVGLLAEEYDPESKRLVGNFPQAFSHVALINTAWNLSRSPGPADIRPKS